MGDLSPHFSVLRMGVFAVLPCRWEYHQVLCAVVILFVVYVMYHLLPTQHAAKRLFHHESMLGIVSLFCGAGMIWRVDKPISATHDNWLHVCGPGALVAAIKAGHVSADRNKHLPANSTRSFKFLKPELRLVFMATFYGATLSAHRWIRHKFLTAIGAFSYFHTPNYTTMEF